MIAEMVREMMLRGVDVEVICLAVETAERALVSSNSGGNPQMSADASADSRREKDRIRKQIERDNLRKSAESADNPQMSNNASISKDLKKDSKRQNRGTRIADNWTTSDADQAFAKAEGFSEWEIQREVQKFRDFWTACAGAKGVKLDWPATWRQWIRNGADRAGKRPAPVAAVGEALSGYYAKADSEQLAAWDAHSVRATGKLIPRDRNFGWHVKSEWPPDYQHASEAAE